MYFLLLLHFNILIMAELQSVKVKSETVKRVKRYVIDTGETISEFIDSTLNKKLDAIEKRKLSQNNKPITNEKNT